MAKKESKNVVVSADDFEAALKSEAQVFDSVTIGIAPRKEGGYNVVKISLDSKGLEAGDVEVIATAETKWEANEMFKINVIKLGVM